MGTVILTQHSQGPKEHKESFQKEMIMNFVERSASYSESGDIAESI